MINSTVFLLKLKQIVYIIISNIYTFSSKYKKNGEVSKEFKKFEQKIMKEKKKVEKKHPDWSRAASPRAGGRQRTRP